MIKVMTLHLEGVSWMTDNPLITHNGYDIISYYSGMGEYIKILKEILGKDEFKKSIIDSLKELDYIKVFGEVNSDDTRYNFCAKFHVSIDEEMEFYLKLKYDEWFNKFMSKLILYKD